MTSPFRAALDASGYVGTWETDLDTQVVALTGALPDLLGIAAPRAAAGVPLAAFLEGVHPDDRARVAHLVREAHTATGRFEAEFRTRNRDGDHWVAARGRVETDAAGRGLRCLGIAVDVTDSRQADPAGDRTVQAVDRIADALLAVRPLTEDLDSPILRTLIDALLHELGTLLARHTRGDARGLH
ncbi:PAS domain-containing protein [Methylobacterium sp. NEAU 140]|uniref:PAS domain-containing protein n=1 Tax=Methylobacterium sp. NEAU 140 TaxID=3064945 RepID=UPI002735A3C7|nr:PAS domain-containing protein [Methylobacterium sp. NEAU 140]MDP4025432.1 PAS domain-containing protein [Methylobacterium sp. NEAU 140]